MLRFQIRDLLWLTIVVALAVGLCLQGHARRQVEAKFQKMDHDRNVSSRHVQILESQLRSSLGESRRLDHENMKLHIELMEAQARTKADAAVGDAAREN